MAYSKKNIIFEIKKWVEINSITQLTALNSIILLNFLSDKHTKYIINYYPDSLGSLTFIWQNKLDDHLTITILNNTIVYTSGRIMRCAYDSDKGIFDYEYIEKIVELLDKYIVREI